MSIGDVMARCGMEEVGTIKVAQYRRLFLLQKSVLRTLED